MKKIRFIFGGALVLVTSYLLFTGLNMKKSIVVGFTGDVMLGRLVNQAMREKGTKYPWGNVLKLMSENDLNIINLETTLTKSEKRVFKVFNFKADPDKVQSLVEAKISLVNLANNHCLDFDIQGLFETLKVLEENGIKYVGVGENITQARKAVTLEKDSIKIGILGYTDNEPDWAAGSEKPGINYLKVGDIEKVRQDVKSIRDEVDILVVSIHWGPNKIERPTKEFVDFAHQIIECGVDIIHGHSAHIFQGIEIYNDKIIMYSTGDFIDDYMVYPDLRNDYSFLFRIKLAKSGLKEIELIPVVISDMQVNVAKDEVAQKILKRLKKLSAEFDTHVEIKDKKGFIKIKN